MDFVSRFSGTGPQTSRFSANTLFKFTELTPVVQKHVEKVYATLAAALLVSAAGCYVNILTGLGGWLTMLTFVGSVVWLSATPPEPRNLNKRYALLAGAAFSQGASLGPLIAAAAMMDAGLVLTAFCGTAILFACFSLAALVSRRRSFLYLGGVLGSAISCFMMMRLATWLLPSMRTMAFQAELYGGLAVFALYVAFDTQVIVEQAFSGNLDHVKHALDLFVDFAAIFVRVLVILMQKEARKDEKRRRKNE
jgi:FtsH-binding integral membrane protein